MTDQEIIDLVEYWVDHYRRNGWRHCGNTSDEKVLELYWENILNKVINECPENAGTEEELEERISKLF